MDSGLYAAYTGLMARTQALDITANNLANVGTNGFRAQHEYFRRIVNANYEPSLKSQVGQSVNGFGILGGNHLNLGQGHLQSTGNPLDIAIQGDGYFGLKTSAGTVYTRNGSFYRSSRGVLQSAQGEPVLDVNQRLITIPTGAVHIASDGNISVSTSSGNSIVGKVGVFAFADNNALSADGVDRLSVGGNATPKLTNATILQGSIESSNEDAISGSMKLVLVQRQAEMMQKALSVFNNDFNKIAADELSRI